MAENKKKVHKKITIGFVATALAIVNDLFGPFVDDQTVHVVAAIIMSLLVGQGLGDLGKYLGQELVKEYLKGDSAK